MNLIHVVALAAHGRGAPMRSHASIRVLAADVVKAFRLMADANQHSH